MTNAANPPYKPAWMSNADWDKHQQSSPSDQQIQALADEQMAMENAATFHDTARLACDVAVEANKKCRPEFIHKIAKRGSKWVVEKRRRADNKIINIL